MDEKFRPAAQYKAGESREAWSGIEKEVREAPPESAKRAVLRRQLAAMLHSRPTPDAARMAARQLAIIGTADEVPALEALLSEPNYADAARYALESIPGSEASAALRRALARSEGTHRIGIINSIGMRRDAGAVRALRSLALSRDEAVRSAAIHALGQIGGDSAVKALRRLPNADGGEVAAALLACADGFVESDHKAKAAPIYEAIWNSSLSTPTRNAALQGWLAARGNDGIPFLLEAIQSSDDKIASAAQRFARDMPGGFPATLALAEAVPRLRPAGQIRLIHALADRGDVSALAPVTQAGLGANKAIRMAAYEGLGSLGDATVVAMLVQAAGSREPDEAEVARAALCAMRDEHVNQALVRLLETMDEPTRVQIVEILAARRASEASSDLIRTTLDSSPAVRRGAWAAVASAGNPSELPQVLDHLVKETDEEAREEGVKAVGAIIARSPDHEAATGEVLKALDAGKGDSFALVWVLGISRGENALGRLTPLLKDPAWQDRMGMIVDTLADWDNDKPADALLAYARTTKSDMYRGTALGGYVHLTALHSNASAQEKARRAAAALAVAHNNDERRAAVYHVRELGSREGLELLRPSLESSDGDMRQLAAESSIALARAISGEFPEEAKAALKRAAAASPIPSISRDAQQAIATIEAVEDFITGWEVSGPYRERNMTANEVFAKAFEPEDPAAKDVQWKPIAAGTDPGRPWLIDLSKAIGGDNRAAYLRTQVWSPKTQQATLELGSDDGVKAWLNGALIHENNASRGVQPAQDKVQIELKEGWNALMLKIVNGGADWGACARIRGTDGGKIEGLKIKIGA